MHLTFRLDISQLILITAENFNNKYGLYFSEYQKKESARKQIKISEIKLTEDLCEVIGAFIGDGFFNCYNNRTYQIEFSGDSRYDLEYYQQKIIPSFKAIAPGLNPHILKVKNKNSIKKWKSKIN